MKTALVIFGITGDLSRRKLLPALENIFSTGNFQDVSIIGLSRQATAPSTFAPTSLVNKIEMKQLNMTHLEDYQRLTGGLREYDQVVIYLSVPPLAVDNIIGLLGQAKLNDKRVKILLEKPFGIDSQSAQEILELTAQYFEEDQTYRIDHYLAKEMAQNIITFRCSNALFARLWSNEAIESVDIIATESIGIENRAEFYEQTGALRDVVQGHLMQLLSLVLIEPPDDLDWHNVPELRAHALSSLKLADPNQAFRGQYQTYAHEVGQKTSATETFAAVTLWSEDPKWQEVPFRLTTGKALDRKTTEIHVQFKKTRQSQANRLVFHIQPDEGVQIDLFVKQPGYEDSLVPRSLQFRYPEDEQLPDAYEQVLVDAIRSRRNLFASSEEVALSWKILQPLLDSWSMDGSEGLIEYTQGDSWSNVLARALKNSDNE